MKPPFRLPSLLAVCATLIATALLLSMGCGGPEGRKQGSQNTPPAKGLPEGWDGKSDWNLGRWRAVDP